MKVMYSLRVTVIILDSVNIEKWKAGANYTFS